MRSISGLFDVIDDTPIMHGFIVIRSDSTLLGNSVKFVS